MSPPPVVAPKISNFQQGGGKEHKPGSKAGQLLMAAHTRPSGTALRSARARPSSKGEGGHHLFGGFLGIRMKFCETALC